MNDRFKRELPHLKPLPAIQFDTSYREVRRVPADAYIEVRANRYSVPAGLVGQSVSIRIGLDDTLRVYDAEDALVANHLLKSGKHHWVLESIHHRALYEAVKVETRDLSHYVEVI